MAQAAADLLPVGVAPLDFGPLDELPHFNPDVEETALPETAARLRELVGRAAGIVLACPEYAHGASAIMKNALEWLVGGTELLGKPVALISASTAPTGGDRAQKWLRETLEVMDARVLDESVLVPTAGRTIVDGMLVDTLTRDDVARLMRALVAAAEDLALEQSA